jgi:hypothetical protein
MNEKTPRESERERERERKKRTKRKGVWEGDTDIDR